MRDDDTPDRDCPQCRALLGDGADGAEVCYCAACGYCSHPSTSGRGGRWVCNACDKDLGPLSTMVQG